MMHGVFSLGRRSSIAHVARINLTVDLQVYLRQAAVSPACIAFFSPRRLVRSVHPAQKVTNFIKLFFHKNQSFYDFDGRGHVLSRKSWLSLSSAPQIRSR